MLASKRSGWKGTVLVGGNVLLHQAKQERLFHYASSIDELAVDNDRVNQRVNQRLMFVVHH